MNMTRRLLRLLLWGGLTVSLLFPAAASAQNSVFLAYGGFSASGRSSNISATTSSSRTAIPTTTGNTLLVANTGSNTVFLQLGNSSVTATTTGGVPLFASSYITLTVGGNTNIAAITASSTSTVVVLRGTGVPAMAGGGSSGGGGGGAVTIADGADAAEGTTTDAACATDNGTCTVIALLKRNNQRLTAGIGTKAPGTAAANSILGGALYDASTITLTDGQQAALQLDSNGNIKAAPGIATVTLTAWNTSTALNSTQVLMVNHGAPALLVQLNQGATLTAGAVTFEGTYDGTNWGTIPVAQVLNPNTYAPLTNPYTMVSSTNQPFLILAQGYQSIRIKLSTAITTSAGVGTSTPFVSLLPYNPTVSALLNPLAAGSAVVGKVGIDQTTPGTTNAVQAIAGTSGGASTTGNIAANNTTAVVVKASAGTLYGGQLGNIGAGPAYLKIYDATSATCGSGTPKKRLIIPKSSTAADGGGSNFSLGDVGVAFPTGITYCLTTGILDNDTTAPAASTVLVNLDWK